MLQAAIEVEVDDFLAQHAERRDNSGRRLVVRNGYLPPRELFTGAGSLAVQQPRVRDKSPDPENGSVSRRASCRRICVEASQSKS